MEEVHHGGGEALARIEAEQGNPKWDILMMDGHGSVRSLADRDFLLTDFQPDNLDQLGELGLSLVPDDYAYFPIGLHASAVIAYNTNFVSEEDAPRTWEQFFAYEGPVGHADPAVAAPSIASWNDYRLEIDSYDQFALSIVEVEFASENEALAFHPPSWFGEELDHTFEHNNKSLWKKAQEQN